MHVGACADQEEDDEEEGLEVEEGGHGCSLSVSAGVHMYWLLLFDQRQSWERRMLAT